MSSKDGENTPFNDMSRRKFLGVVAAGGAISVAGISMGGKTEEVDLLRPPGSIEEDGFLSLCARCGRCVSVCPNSALRLQGFENGVHNWLTPELVPGNGYCIMPVNGCQRCIEACPAKVLQPIDLEDVAPGELSGRLKMGTASVDTDICIPYSLKQPCLACKEICPVEGAITTHGGEGEGGRIKKPEFNNDICVGCGACENACPTTPKAVTVSSEGALRTGWRDRI